MTRYMKALIAILIMLLSGTYFLLNEDLQDLMEPDEIIPFLIIIVGTVVCLFAMRSSLKDVLSAQCVFIGLYLITKALPNIFTDIDEHFLITLLMFVVGVAIVFMGVNLWCGYNYNIVRIRFASLVVMAIGGIQIAVYWLITCQIDGIDFVAFFNRCLGVLMVLMQGVSIALIAYDHSLGYTSLNTLFRHNVRAMEMRMNLVEDAYILSPNIKLIDKVSNSDDDRVMMTLFSNSTVKRTMVFRRTGGQSVLEINARDHTYINPIISMDVSDIVYSDDTITFYGYEGHRIRIMVYDKIQENYDKPMFFGQQIDIDTFVDERKLRKLFKKNIKADKSDPDNQE